METGDCYHLSVPVPSLNAPPRRNNPKYRKGTYTLRQRTCKYIQFPSISAFASLKSLLTLCFNFSSFFCWQVSCCTYKYTHIRSTYVKTQGLSRAHQHLFGFFRFSRATFKELLSQLSIVYCGIYCMTE